MKPDVGTFILKHVSENQERPHSTIRKCAGKARSPNNNIIICITYLCLMVGYGCYRECHSACCPSSTSWSLRAHVWCGCEEVVPQWMIFPMVVNVS